MMPTDSKSRKDVPITTGVLDYFPLTMVALAQLAKAGNDKHNPGQPLHWSRDKSSDHADCIARHLIQRGTEDVPEYEGGPAFLHDVKLAWRALANCEIELESRERKHAL